MKTLTLPAAVGLGVLLGFGFASAQPTKPAEPPKSTEPPKITEVAGKDLKKWIAETKDPDPSVKEKAIRTLILFGESARDDIGPALIDRLTDGDVSVRTNAVIALGALGVGEKELHRAVDGLAARAAEDSQAVVRYHAAFALGRYGPDAKRAIPKLILASKDSRAWEIRKAACYALGTAATDTKDGPEMSAFRALLNSLAPFNETCSEVRREAAIAVTGLGKPALKPDQIFVLSTLRQRLSAEKDKEVVVWLHMAILVNDDSKDKDATIDAIAKILKDKDAAAREQAVGALGMLGTRARGKIPDLIDALQDKDPQVVFAAVMALANMGDNDGALRGLEAFKKQKDTPEPLKKLIGDILDKAKDKPKK